ncbi:MAG: cyclic nucleotide-binding domain-containing protein, partial [Gammaproteobacteria bacterium]|nr:cyclic nucleotide-binding domain-containing protein [Gammaproteobacteria bacterium]
MNIHDYFHQFKLTDAETAQLDSRFHLKAFKPGEIIVRQGGSSDSFFCVASGELAVVLEQEDGSEITMDVLDAGQFFGEMGLLQKTPRTATIRALTHTQVYRAEKADFFSLVEQSPSFSLFLDQLRLKRQFTRIPCFSRLSDNDLTKVISIQQHKEVTAGTVLCHQGHEANKLFIIAKGSAKVIRRDMDGSENLMGNKLPSENYVDDAFFKGQQNTAELVMQEDGEVLVIDRAALMDLANHHPSIAAELPLRKNPLKAVLPFFYDKAAYFVIPKVSMNRPRLILWGMLSIMLLLMVHAIVPSIWPEQFPLYNALKIDTDPENMLAEDEPARVLHNKIKKQMKLYDLMVVGVVNETHPDGVYNTGS